MIKFSRKLLILFFIFLVILFIIIVIVGKIDKVISKVDIISNNGLVYISKQRLIDKVLEVSNRAWFNIDVSSIENFLYTIKGFDCTLVKKVWPSTLVIYLFDHKPIAYWNNNQILLDNMEVITPEVLSYNGNLPYIESTDIDGRNYIFEIYHNLDSIAKAYSLSILKITYKGNQFSFLLSNDIQVILGSSNLRLRFKLFLDSYKRVKDYESVVYFDMRYSNGFTIKYK